jgi:hypothetical protein
MTNLELKNSRWLTVKQAAKVFPFSENGLRWLIFKKQPDFLHCIRKVGSRILINSAALDDWINHQEVNND